VAPNSYNDSKESTIHDVNRLQPPKKKSRSRSSKKSKSPGLQVGERLYALGKLYDAKKGIMRDRL